MANISSADLKKCISSILKDADLSELSSKMIRKRCGEHFGINLDSRKLEIDKIIMAIIAKLEIEKNNSENDENESDDSSKKSAASDSKSEKSDLQDKSSNNKKQSSSSKAKKKKKENHVLSLKHKNKNSNSDADSDDDAVLAKQLQDEEWNLRSRSSKRPAAAKKLGTKSKKEEDGKSKSSRKGSSIYTRKCALSEELAEIMETNEMARPDVVKKMWSIARERDLFDPSNKQFVLCDEQLRRVFGAKRIRMFSMMKYLKNHMKDLK